MQLPQATMRMLALMMLLAMVVQVFALLEQAGKATPSYPDTQGVRNNKGRELQGHHPFGGHHGHGGHHQKLDCTSACDFRCSKASKSKPCHKYCNLCCQKCDCVPPGTYGNKEVCPCYNNMRNSRGSSKCP